jgi:hypothetical protein
MHACHTHTLPHTHGSPQCHAVCDSGVNVGRACAAFDDMDRILGGDNPCNAISAHVNILLDGSFREQLRKNTRICSPVLLSLGWLADWHPLDCLRELH